MMCLSNETMVTIGGERYGKVEYADGITRTLSHLMLGEESSYGAEFTYKVLKQGLKGATLSIPSIPGVQVGTTLRELVQDSLREVGAPVLSVEIRYSEALGLHALAVLDCDARQALKCWLKVVDRLRSYDIPVFVMWMGVNNVSPGEMGAYIGKILAKMNVFLATKEPIDVVKTLREEWSL